MNLLVVGDYTNDDPTVEKIVKERLFAVDSQYGITKLITFNEPGIDEIAYTWAFDESIEFDIYDASKSKWPLNKVATPPKSLLKNMVTDYQIDSFLFYFLENDIQGVPNDNSVHRRTIRTLFARCKKYFNTKTIFSSHKYPPK